MDDKKVESQKNAKPIVEEPKLSYQRPQPKDSCKYSNIGIPTKDKPLLTCCIMDLPVAERKKHMWHIPKELHCNEMYCIEPKDCVDLGAKNEKEKKEREEKEQKEKQERKNQDEKKTKIIQDQSITINTLQTQINSMMTDVSSLHSALSQVIQELNNMKAK